MFIATHNWESDVINSHCNVVSLPLIVHVYLPPPPQKKFLFQLNSLSMQIRAYFKSLTCLLNLVLPFYMIMYFIINNLFQITKYMHKASNILPLTTLNVQPALMAAWIGRIIINILIVSQSKIIAFAHVNPFISLCNPSLHT